MEIKAIDGLDTPINLDFLRRAFEKLPANQTLTIQRELTGGKTGAAVMLVDIAYHATGVSPQPNHLEGQFVLKVESNKDSWGELNEAKRHLAGQEWNPDFFKSHVPQLRHNFEEGRDSCMLYEIAASSQIILQSLSYLGALTRSKCCRRISDALLTDLNKTCSLEHDLTSTEIMSRWLGYRLDPVKAPALHEFVAKETLSKKAFTIGENVLINPLWLAANADIGRKSTVFNGLIHGDFHLGNVFFVRSPDDPPPYWIIDWALSKQGPLFFDHCYLEVSLLLSELSGADASRIGVVLAAVDAVEDRSNAVDIPPAYMSLCDCLTASRQAMHNWQANQQPRRRDPFLYQVHLARIAAGLNWANKPLSLPDKRLGLIYAARAATAFLKTFNATQFAEAMLDASSSTIGLAKLQDTQPAVDSAQWKECWDALGQFDESLFSYILVADAVRPIENLKALGMLPWSAIIDLDENSDEKGLYSALSPILERRRSLVSFGKERRQVNFNRGTAWFMANGWTSRSEMAPGSPEIWRREYLRLVRQVAADHWGSVAPRKTKVVVLRNHRASDRLLSRVVEAIDEELGGSAEFFLFPSADNATDTEISAKTFGNLAWSDFGHYIKSKYGDSEETAMAFLPGASGRVELAVTTLRNWQEDLEVLHSNILNESDTRLQDDDAFFRGMPPTWTEIDVGLDIQRDIHGALVKEITERLSGGRNFTIEFQHSPGAGATTAAMRAIWTLHRQHPVAVLRRFSRLTSDRLDAIYQKTQKPVLLLADSSDLSPTERDSMFVELARRNVKVVLLLLSRRFKPGSDAGVSLFDPMAKPEAKSFIIAYRARCRDYAAVKRLNAIGGSALDDASRSPFFIGLATYDSDFLHLDSYVKAHLSGIRPLPRQALLYSSLATYYSQKGVSEQLFMRFLQVSPTGKITLQEAVGLGPASLLVQRGNRVKVSHPLVAKFVLQTLVSDGDPVRWKFGLKDICIQVIRDVVGISGAYSEETKDLFTQLFIRRDHWSDELAKGHFSPLIEDLPTDEGQQQVLSLLCEQCPDEPHYWNHRGRHIIYNTNQNFELAETYLKEAIRLSNGDDALHFHALGMVYRFWIKAIANTFFKGGVSEGDRPGSEVFLAEVEEIAARSLEAFSKARELDADDAHACITPIQTILFIVEKIIQASDYKSLGDLAAGTDLVAMWLQTHIPEAEALLERVQRMRGPGRPTMHEEICITALNKVYGRFDTIIKSWLKATSAAKDKSFLRRAVASAYYAKSKRLWSHVPQDELRAVVQLMEQNLAHDPTNENDIRIWFHALRRLPDFTFDEALDRLQAWASRSDSVDAFYYIYILHFLRWKGGGEVDQKLVFDSLSECAQRAHGQRYISYEWLGLGPAWCPLVNARDLGSWDTKTNFFVNPRGLALQDGIITSLKRTAGQIKIGKSLKAFFVPSVKIRESEHINAKVQFYLGFSYERLHAWSVEVI
jgi:tetratricopeptide (TPR) repeat protein